jgi:acyl transferase domain-containing protein
MRPAALATEGSVVAARPRPPARTLYSAYTGGLLPDDTARDVAFWSHQLAEPVLFWPALDALLATGDLLLVEAGPGQGLTNVARQHPAVRARTSDAVALLPARPSGPVAERRAALTVAARLWLDGHPLRPETLVDGLPT